MTPAVEHVPVLLDRVLELFEPALAGRDAVVVDATLVLGGHAEAMLDAHPGLRLVGIDRDAEAIARSSARLARFAGRTTFVHARYDELTRVLGDLGVDHVDGVLLDLGVSSMQLDRVERGFSYAHDAPLDMRMDPATGHPASEVLNTYPAPDLARILREYGEERFAKRIADAIVRERAQRPFTSSARLVEIVRAAIPAATRRTGGNPAKRTFQALRIEVNAELEVLERAMPAAIAAITVGGRIVVLAYHSLEDRIVKRALRAAATSTAPPGMPIELPEHEPQLRLLTRGAEKASDAETAANPRAASVRLRAAERVRAAA